jgi:hypothetical protein
MCFWAEGSTNLTLNNVAAQANATLTSGAVELSANYLTQLHGVFFQANLAGAAPSGGSITSYPYALRCDSDAAVGGYYSASVSACDSTRIDAGSWFVGGIKLDGSGINPPIGLPSISDSTFEEMYGNAVAIDNRNGIQTGSCLALKNTYMQDNFSNWGLSLFSYTDNAYPSGCVTVDNNDTVDSGALANNYFNGSLSVNGINQGTGPASPAYLNASSGVYNEGNRIRSEIENEGASFSPSIVPYGSLPMSNYSIATLQSLCTTAGNCTITQVTGPDGPSGKMLAFEMDTSATGADIVMNTTPIATYQGDHFLIWSWVRPGENNVTTVGFVGTQISNGNGFYLRSGGHFYPTLNQGGNIYACTPAAFDTQLNNNGWAPEVAICTISVGYSTPYAAEFHLTASNGATSQTRGNQYAEPGYVFIPGPNNPACSAAGTCNLSADQIEEARRDQYHGFVPPGMSAGTAATGETVSANGYTVNGTALNAPSETYNASASGSITLPSADRAEATYVLSGNVTASIGAGTGGGKVTIFVCQPTSGGPYTWTWPTSWKGGATVGTAASTCSEQTGTYISGLGDWHGDAGSTDVPQ